MFPALDVPCFSLYRVINVFNTKFNRDQNRFGVHIVLIIIQVLLLLGSDVIVSLITSRHSKIVVS